MVDWGKMIRKSCSDGCVRYEYGKGTLEARSYGSSTLRLTWKGASARVWASPSVVAKPSADARLLSDGNASVSGMKLSVDPESGEITVTGKAGLILSTKGGITGGGFAAHSGGSSGGSVAIGDGDYSLDGGDIGMNGDARMDGDIGVDGDARMDGGDTGMDGDASMNGGPGRGENRKGLSLEIALDPHESVYGLGEKTGLLDKRGRRYQMWNTDDPLHTPDKDPLYQSIGFLSRFDGVRSSGLFLDTVARSFFDVGFTREDSLVIETGEDILDLYVFDGGEGGPAAVSALYSALTGTMKLPPLWALGYQQCRWSYCPESNVVAVAEEFRKRDIPCDVIYLDIDYMDGYRVFTWDRGRFPDPARMAAKLHGMGFRLVTIVDPGVKKDSSYRVYVDGRNRGAFCALLTGEVYHGKVWPGDAAYPDFSSVDARSWWADLHKTLFDAGVDGVWNDMNEPSDFLPESGGDRTKATVPDCVMMRGEAKDGSDARSFADGHNAYGFDMARATEEAFGKLKAGERPFILTRSGCAGIQRHATVWTGDNHSWWEHLASGIPMLLNLSLSGVPFCGGDAGGFQGEASPELFARWMQLAAFTPFFRAHSAIHTKPHEPWAFGPETARISREAIRLRYRLMPYIYGEMRRAALTGVPLMRAMVYEFPRDPETRTMADQFMFGPSILVAPVTQAGKKERIVYLPEGIWYDFHSGERISGGRSFIAKAPLDVIPLYVRAGAIIPMVECAPHTGALDMKTVTVRAYAGAEGSFEFYEDDGCTNAYERGEYNLSRITVSDDGKPEVRIETLRRGWKGGCPNPRIEIVGSNPS